MLSIGIPTFNYNITDLVGKLYKQIELLNLPIEIIVIDDGSSEKYRKINSGIKQLPFVHYVEQENQGRSSTRNRLASLAKYQHILYIDCDCDIEEAFLSKYISVINDSSVIVGGLKYPPLPADKELMLRWKVGQQKEVKPLKQRIKHPYSNFLSSNFAIPVQYIRKKGFDIELSQYGHEDTIFGSWLANNKIRIEHIDNPVIHLGLETADQYLKKVRESVSNALLIYHKDPKSNDIKLFKYYRIIKTIKLESYFCTIFESLQTRFEQSFSQGNTSLLLLDLYKLGIFCTLINKKKVHTA